VIVLLPQPSCGDSAVSLRQCISVDMAYSGGNSSRRTTIGTRDRRHSRDVLLPELHAFLRFLSICITHIIAGVTVSRCLHI